VLAALIVGVALIMDVPTPFTLFGYPGAGDPAVPRRRRGRRRARVKILVSDITAKRKPSRGAPTRTST
jgi:hypothetical protein